MMFWKLRLAEISMIRFRSWSFLTLNLCGVIAFIWPFLLPSLHDERLKTIFNSGNSKWWALVVLPISIWFFFRESETQLQKSNLVSKKVALLGVLIALACVMRFLGAGAVGIEPIWYLLIIVGFVFGARFGFLFGVLGLLVSGIFLGGFGPWLPFQMLAAGWITGGAGLLNKFGKFGKFTKGRFKSDYARLILIPYSIVASFAFGLLMDLQLWPWLIDSQSQLAFSIDNSTFINLRNFLIFHFTTSLAWDLPRAILTASLIFFAGNLLISALERTALRLQLN